jgi:hypothetical protein
MTRGGSLLKWVVLGLACALATTAAGAGEMNAADGCSRFTWDVSHELAVMKQTPQPQTASTKAGADAPLLQLDKVYELKLAPQAGVSFAVKPGKPTLDDSAQAGVVRFRVDKPGRYRVSITSGHWLDIVADQQLVKSRDFQGARGCERPHKIVEYELPAAREFTLQLSGSTDASVILAITPVKAGPAS